MAQQFNLFAVKVLSGAAEYTSPAYRMLSRIPPFSKIPPHTRKPTPGVT